MINSALYREPVLLDSALHRGKRLKPLTDFSITRNMHAVLLTATEFAHAALDLPIIFVHTGERLPSGKPMVSPVVLLGLSSHENLRLTPEGRWDARYIPAFIRRFPFLTAGVKGSHAPGVFVDAAWSGFNDAEGEPLFNAQGEPTETLQRALDFLQRFDEEQRRTRAFCQRVAELDILKEVQVDVNLPDAKKLTVNGFLTVDEEKLNQLPDATVVELHRSGMLMLMQVHLLSMNNLPALAERKAARQLASAAAAA